MGVQFRIRVEDLGDEYFKEDGAIARITINRPRYRNAFTPTTVMEISNALSICREDADIRVVVLTGAHSPAQEGQTEAERLRTEAFCYAVWAIYPRP